MSELAGRIQDLSPDKLKSLMAELQRRKSPGAQPQAAAPKPLRRTGQSVFPLSYEQERVWFTEQLLEGSEASGVYHWPFATVFEVALEPAIFRMVLQRLVERHEILRTTYMLDQGKPRQVVAPVTGLSVGRDLGCADLAAFADPEAEAIRRLREDMLQPFNLEKGPLFRFYLYQLGSNRTLFGGTIHHSIIDGWSRKVLVEDMGRLAQQITLPGSGPALPPLALQYADYALWQRENAVSEKGQKSLAYWKQKLHGVPDIELAADRPRPERPTPGGGIERIELSPALTQALRALAQQQGTTTFVVLLTAFLLLLSRRTGSPDLCCAVPVANRAHPEFENLIGFFVNTILLREQIDPAETFAALLARVKATFLDALSHQDTPFEQLVEELRPKRELGRNPFTPYMFQLEAKPAGSGQPTMAEREIQVGLSVFDLEIHLYDPGTSGQASNGAGSHGGSQPGIFGTLTYSAELFRRESIEYLLAGYFSLLQAAVESPATLVASLPVVGRQEAADLARWSTGPSSTHAFVPVHTTIAEAAAHTPFATAVRGSGGDDLCYAELEALSTRVCQALQALGVKVGDLVAVALDRTPQMVAALLGVLKTGAAYLPLDLRHPAGRLHSILEDASPACLLTQSIYAESLFASFPQTVAIELLETARQPSAVGTPFRGPKLSPDDLAYVIYTSGSTGRPKGVAVRHGGLANVLKSLVVSCGFHSEEAWLSLTSLSFDISALELLLPLILGATSVIATTDEIADPETLAAIIERYGISVIQATPPLWQMLIGPLARLDNCQFKILSGGERLPAEVGRQLRSLSPHVWNLYGPTETTIYSSIHRVEENAAAPPIGVPLAETRLYVLGPDLERLPVGVPGDLYIAGEGLARGYRGRPDLTAAAFLPDPFADRPGQRIYLTGDHARYRADGEIVFIGREDSQVKLRGYRIELGEVEACLLRHSSVSNASVHLVEDPAGRMQLVAYYRLDDADAPVTRVMLRAHLAERLPDYMVPATFVRLDAWPLTVNGKLDRSRLTGSADPNTDFGPAYEPPVNTLEATLAEIWSSVLRKPRVGRRDNFFEQGGDSLASVQVSYLAREKGIALRPTHLFQQQTLAGLAELLQPGPSSPDAVTTSPLSMQDDQGSTILLASGGAEPLFLVHPAGGDVMCYYHLAQAIPGRPVVGLTYRDYPGFRTDRIAVEELAAWYLSAIRDRWPQGPYVLGGWSFGALVAYEMATQLEAEGLPAANLVLIDQPAPAARGDEQQIAVPGSISVARIAEKIETVSGVHLGISEAALEAMDEEQQLTLLVTRMKLAGLIPETILPAAMRDFVCAYDEHMRAATVYRAGVYHGSMTLLCASDPTYRDAGLAEDTGAPALGWERLLGRSIAVLPVEGNHLTLVSPQHAASLGATIHTVLNQAPDQAPSGRKESL